MRKGKKYYIKKLDKLFSDKVRSIGKCQRCSKSNCRVETAHIISRKNKTLRWDDNNALCFCTTCHFWGHQDPLGFSLFVEKSCPKRYKYLMENKNRLTKRSAKDLKELLEKTAENLKTS